jgi:hypothetical protein
MYSEERVCLMFGSKHASWIRELLIGIYMLETSLIIRLEIEL